MPTIAKVKMTRLAAIGLLLLLIVTPLFVSHLASAASLAEVMVRFDRMKTSTQTTGTVCAKPTTAGTEGKVIVTFPAGFTLGAFGTFTINTTASNWPANGTAWTGITAPAGAGDITGQAVTFASGDLVVNSNVYCFNWTNSAAVQTASGASNTLTGSVATQTAASAAIDSATYTTNTIADDQIAVSATVPQAFTFALSANTDNLGTLSTGAVATSPTPRTVTINTNAKIGWQVWAQDANTGLNSASASKTIASTTPGSNSTLSNGTEGYNMGVTSSQGAGSGTITVPAGYTGGSLGRGGGLDTTLRTIASSNGTAQNAVLTMNNNAAISSLTPAAADYSDTITIVGAGLF